MNSSEASVHIESKVDCLPCTRRRSTAVGPTRLSASNHYRRRKGFHCKCILSYNCKFKIIWDWIVLLLVLFTAVQVPFMAAFPSSSKLSTTSFSVFYGNGLTNTTVLLGLLVDLMFVLDILINFRTTFLVTDSDELVTQPKRIAIHYLKTWFWIDFLAALPFDWFIRTGPNQKDETATLIGLLKSARLLRLFRVARKLDRYSEYGIAVLFLLMCLFTLIGHWLACVWHAIGNATKDDPNGWVYRFDMMTNLKNTSLLFNDDMYRRKKYITALYFVMTSLTSVGFGNVSANNEAEQIFTILVMLLGALMYACIFGNMVAIVQRLYLKTSTFHSEMNTIKEFIKFYKFPDELKRTIQAHSRHEWTISDGVSADRVLARFPESLQADICYEIYNDLFADIPCMNLATVGCMRAMARRFKTAHLQSGHFALRQGDEVQDLYILESGRIDIIHDEAKKGEMADVCLFGYNFNTKPKIPKANASLRAANTAKIHYISKVDMEHVLRFYPNFAKKFKRFFIPRYEICNEIEEGLGRRARIPKKSSTATSVARSMIKLSFMSKLNKSKLQQQQQQTKQSNSSTSIEHPLNGSTGYMVGVSTHPSPSLELAHNVYELNDINTWTEDQHESDDHTDDHNSDNNQCCKNEIGQLKLEIESLKNEVQQVTHVIGEFMERLKSKQCEPLQLSSSCDLSLVSHKESSIPSINGTLPSGSLA